MQNLGFKMSSTGCIYKSKAKHENLKLFKTSSALFRLSLCICLFQIYLFQIVPVAAFQDDQKMLLAASRSDNLGATEDTKAPKEEEGESAEAPKEREEESAEAPKEGKEESAEAPKEEEELFSTQNVALALLLAGTTYFLSNSETSTQNETSGSNITWGNNAIGASAAHNAGYTGSGIKVGVVDTGIDKDHYEFSGKTIRGKNYTIDSASYDVDEQGHGTHVASVIAGSNDGNGITGVAYNSELYSFKLLNSQGMTDCTDCDQTLADIINDQKSENIQVSNNSWGSDTNVVYDTSFLSFSPQFTQAIVNATDPNDNPIIFVFAAGNSGYTNPSSEAALPYLISDPDDRANVEAHWLAVVAVDENMKEADFTNRCGVAQDWCVAAPGVGIVAAQANSGDGLVSFSGTSMAAPYVSGAVAVLLERFSALTPAEVVTRLKEGATCSGLTNKYGNVNTSTECSDHMKDVFGHGFISLDNSLNTLGSLTYAGGSTWNSAKSVNLSEARVPLPAGFASALGQDFRATDIAVFDSFDGATFWLKAEDVFNFNQEREIAAIGYASSVQTQKSHRMNVFEDTKVSLHFSSADNAWQLGGNTQWDGHAATLAPASFFKNRKTKQTEFVIGLANSISTGAMSFRPFIQHEVEQDYMSVSGLGVNADLSLSTGTNFALSMMQNTQTVNFSSSQDPESDTKAKALTLDFGARQHLGAHVEVFGRASVTRLGQVEATQESWGLEDADLINAVMGFETHVNEQIRLTTGLWQPAQLSGTASYMAPVGRETNGTVIWEQKTAALEKRVSPALFMSLTTPLSKQGHLTLTVQQSPWEQDRIGRAEIRGTMSF